MKSKSLEARPELVEVMLLGSSLARLERAGSADRERDYYRRLAGHFDVLIFGYENGRPDGPFREMSVVFRNKWAQSLLAPFSLKRAGHGVVRTKQFWGCWSGWLLARLSRRPLVIRCGYIWSRAARHQNPHLPRAVHGAMVLLERILMRLGDGFIFATEEIAAHYGPMVGGKPKVVVPNGFNLETFRPRGSAGTEFGYVYVGRLIPLKGIARLLASLPPGSRLLVIGDGDQADLVKAHPQATYLGLVPNNRIPAELARARCFVSMSTTEGNPKCLYEAVLCGLYPVLSDIEAHRNLVRELGYGTLLAPGQPLPEADSLSIDPAKLDRFRADYGFDGVIDREAAFCLGLLEGAPA